MNKADVVYIYIYTHTQQTITQPCMKNKNMPFLARCIELEIIIIQSEVGKTKKDKYYIISHMWNLIF